MVPLHRFILPKAIRPRAPRAGYGAWDARSAEDVLATIEAPTAGEPANVPPAGRTCILD